MKKMILLLSILLLSVQAQAALVSVIGGGQIISAVSVQEDDPTNSVQQGFNEKQGVNILGTINIDGGTLTGKKVDSHLIFLNTKGNALAETKSVWTFDGKIVGVMSNKSGSFLMDTNNQFAAFDDYFTVGTDGPFGALGLEGGSTNGFSGFDRYSISQLGYMLKLNMKVTEPGDWIRVLTVSAVPIPAALFMFAPALLGFMGFRRRRQA